MFLFGLGILASLIFVLLDLRLKPSRAFKLVFPEEPKTFQGLYLRSWISKTVGVLNHHKLEFGELILFKGSRLHTFGMHFPIRTLALSKDFKILAISGVIPPQRSSSPYPRGTKYILEMSIGSADKVCRFNKGEKLNVDYL